MNEILERVCIRLPENEAEMSELIKAEAAVFGDTEAFYDDLYIETGKKNTLASRRQALSFITKEDVVKKLFDVIAPSFEGRCGGYTRVILTGPRRGDAAEMAIIELVAEEKEEKKPAKKAAAKNSGTAKGAFLV